MPANGVAEYATAHRMLTACCRSSGERLLARCRFYFEPALPTNGPAIRSYNGWVGAIHT